MNSPSHCLLVLYILRTYKNFMEFSKRFSTPIEKISFSFQFYSQGFDLVYILDTIEQDTEPISFNECLI